MQRRIVIVFSMPLTASEIQILIVSVLHFLIHPVHSMQARLTLWEGLL
jgi:hypothetical protein